MKNIWLAVLIIFLSSCDDTDDYSFTVFELNELTISPVTEPFGVYSADRDTIVINTLAYEDIRCPIDVTCIRAGYYSVDLELILTPDTSLVSLCNGDCNQIVSIKDSAQVTLRNQAYWIRLDNLLPYPNTARPDQDQTIYFEVFQAD